MLPGHPKTTINDYNLLTNNVLKTSKHRVRKSEELRHRHEILIEIVRLAEKLGIRFAFPTSTLHMENFPGKHSLTPQYDMTMDEFKKEMEDYFKKQPS